MKRGFKTTEYIYGVAPTYFDNMGYYEAIEEKIRLCKEAIEQLEPRISYKLSKVTYERMTAELTEKYEALQFNESLLKERKMYDKELVNSGSYIGRIAQWQIDRNLHTQEYEWKNEVANIVEELLESTGVIVPKEKRPMLKEKITGQLIGISKELELELVEVTKNDIVDAYLDVIVFCVGAVLKLGFNPECAINETIKEISSRTGKIVDGKFQKDTSPEAKAKWYKSDYNECKGNKYV
jgi:hypothetical protein